ncbi:hypothetical protein EYW49_16010 [Siculibacillus lacustris]|uniref:Uncharacterized protein n=1 Tax=Siculibacillus lacustris TaxID=1549641 RepID=A0A4Q9VJV2_9HYPH|nr:integrase core domain-containing protein [Siculibacillus lacustris]TBW35528.1 hypothetical protein EYW49_16010 [Siculibacillus lacustris]
MLVDAGVKIRMNGRGSRRDDVFVERLWRSILYEEVDFRAYATFAAACASSGRYLGRYNGSCPHACFDRRTPDKADFTDTPLLASA